ncbi:MAG TPA: hypothetical protein VJV22_03150 [Acidobacteriaceae bacterium]|nr:hypothetical protein [Acidobacteriaceae bacterium]
MVRLTGLLTLPLIAASCSGDRPVAPTTPVPTPAGRPERSVVTPLGNFQLTIPATNTDGGSLPWTSTGITIPAGSYYRIRINGSVTVSPNPAHQEAYPGGTYPDVGTYGPGGTGKGAWELRVGVRLHNTTGGGITDVPFTMQSGTSAPDSARSDIRYAGTEAVVEAGRAGISGSTNDNCCNGNIGFYTLASTQVVSVELVTDAVHVTADPSAVKAGQRVTFTARDDNGALVGVNSWSYEQDPGVTAREPAGCWWNNPCVATLYGSLTWTAHTNIGTGSAHVTVYSDFRLDADKAEAYAGDTVTFTPKLDDKPAVALRWKWVPSDTSAHDGTICAADSTCKKVMVGSGTMWAYLSSAGGQGDSAAVTVTVIRVCITNDSILDTQAVQRVLRSLWVHSNADDPTTENRREQVAFVYRNPATGEYSAVEWPNPSFNSPCKSLPGSPAASAPPMSWLVAEVHTHPFHAFDGLPIGCTGWLAVGSWAFYDPVSYGGPSGRDWDQVNSMRAVDEQGNEHKIPEYVIDQDYVYKAVPDTPRSQWLLNTPTFPRHDSSVPCTFP